LPLGVADALAVNSPTQIAGIIPALTPNKKWKLQVRTRFTNGSNLLKEVRTIERNFELSQSA
jgi:hypothetical protein